MNSSILRTVILGLCVLFPMSAFATTQTASNTCTTAMSCSVTLSTTPANGDVVTVTARLWAYSDTPYTLTFSDDGGSSYVQPLCANPSWTNAFHVGYALSLAGSATNFKITATSTASAAGEIDIVATVHTPAATPNLDQCALAVVPTGKQLSSGPTTMPRSTATQWLAGSCFIDPGTFAAGTNLAWGNLVVAPNAPNSFVAQESVLVTSTGTDAATMTIDTVHSSICSIMTFNET